ncbi:S100 calcium binding protein T [Betta splendens]|uniref:S100 calcium binding protein T n=1 Tax=Betta splendens TaxID=158456 RepID=A0A6P7KUC2_BETSP|nr:S100 calcium binding protein T [Betta splendens]
MREQIKRSGEARGRAGGRKEGDGGGSCRVGGERDVFKTAASSPPPSAADASPPLPTATTAPSASRMSMPNLENASTLENAMQLLIQTFHKYSGNEGDKYTLSRAELKEMLTAELGNYLGNAQDKEAVDRVMGDLDSNNDGEVDFTEFIILVGALTVACNDFFLEYNEKAEKKK